jgi:hypothetical protein
VQKKRAVEAGIFHPRTFIAFVFCLHRGGFGGERGFAGVGLGNIAKM